MRAVKSILRWFLGLQAVAFSFLSVAVILGSLKMSPHSLPTHAGAAHAHTFSGLILAYCVAALVAILGPIYAMAWWTTRTPSAKLNAWALAASGLNVGLGMLFVWLSRLAATHHVKLSPADGLWFLALGVAGLFFFSRRETQSGPAIAAPKAASVAGDRTSIWTRHTVTALSALTQIAALVFWSRWAFSQHLLRRHGLAWIVLITVASIVTTVVHECGHAVIAWCFEMKLHSFKAGPFQWASREGNWAFKFNAAGLVTPGGSISASPTRPDQAAWEFILMIAAGPGANLLIGAAATWAVLHDRWGTYQQSWEFVAYTGAFCLIGAVLNLIPFLSEEGSYSDGARILQIATHSPHAVGASAPVTVKIADPSPAAAITARPTLKSAAAPVTAAVPEHVAVPPAVTPPPDIPKHQPVKAIVAMPEPQPAPAVLEPQPVPAFAAAPEPQPVPAAVVVPIPPSAPPTRPTLAPGTVRLGDPLVLAAAKAESAPVARPPVLAAIPVMAAAAKPAAALSSDDDQLAARLQTFLARTVSRPAAKAAEPAPAVRIPEPPLPPAAAVKQESAPKPAPQIPAPAAEKQSDPFPRIPPAKTVLAPAAEWIAPGTVPTPQVAANTIEPIPEPATSEAGATGLIASATRIPASAILNAAPKPPTIRLASASAASSTTPAPGSKAPSVPAAFARRARPAPLPAGSTPGIEEILAAAAIPVDDPYPPSIAGEEPALAAPLTSEILPPTPPRNSAPPTAPEASRRVAPPPQRQAPPALLAEATPLGPTFSESWPPRPAATPPALVRSESLEATPAALPSDPTPSHRIPAGRSAIGETPLASPQTESPRSDPFDFLRAAAIESLNANPR
jgi:hypothetical protein